jgi:hypothetical protein
MTKTRTKWYSKAPNKANLSWTHEERIEVYTMRVLKHMEPQRIVDTLKKNGKLRGIGNPRCLRIVYNLVRQARKIAQSCCIRCGKKLTAKDRKGIKSKTLIRCIKCRKHIQKYKNKLRKKFKKRGMCAVCGKNKPTAGRVECKHCLSATYRRRITKGVCGRCGENPIDATSSALCTPCLNLNKERARVYRQGAE